MSDSDDKGPKTPRQTPSAMRALDERAINPGDFLMGTAALRQAAEPRTTDAKGRAYLVPRCSSKCTHFVDRTFGVSGTGEDGETVRMGQSSYRCGLSGRFLDADGEQPCEPVIAAVALRRM